MFPFDVGRVKVLCWGHEDYIKKFGAFVQLKFDVKRPDYSEIHCTRYMP